MSANGGAVEGSVACQLECATHSLHIVRGDQVPQALIGHDTFRPSSPSGDDAKASRHSLDQDDTEGLKLTRENEAVGVDQKAIDTLTRQETKEFDLLLDAQLSGQTPQSGPFRAVTADPQANAGVPAKHIGIRTKKKSVIFSRRQPANGAESEHIPPSCRQGQLEAAYVDKVGNVLKLKTKCLAQQTSEVGTHGNPSVSGSVGKTRLMTSLGRPRRYPEESTTMFGNNEWYSMLPFKPKSHLCSVEALHMAAIWHAAETEITTRDALE
jgi:hypothetical protein